MNVVFTCCSRVARDPLLSPAAPASRGRRPGDSPPETPRRKTDLRFFEQSDDPVRFARASGGFFARLERFWAARDSQHRTATNVKKTEISRSFEHESVRFRFASRLFLASGFSGSSKVRTTDVRTMRLLAAGGADSEDSPRETPRRKTDLRAFRASRFRIPVTFRVSASGGGSLGSSKRWTTNVRNDEMLAARCAADREIHRESAETTKTELLCVRDSFEAMLAIGILAMCGTRFRVETKAFTVCVLQVHRLLYSRWRWTVSSHETCRVTSRRLLIVGVDVGEDGASTARQSFETGVIRLARVEGC